MRAVRRLASGDPGMLADAGMAIAGAALTAVAEWNPASLAGTRIAGPPWLLALLPVLIGAALALRRRAPLLMWLAIWAGVVVQVLVSRHPLQSLYFIVVVFAAAYSLGAHAAARRAAAALAITAPAMALTSHLGGVGTGLSLIPILVFCLAGVLVRARRQSGALATQNVALRRQAEQAVAAERARIARELHDIIAHHLSVIVLQATAAQKPGRPAGPALQKIQNSGRQALTETRRMLGVLYGTDEAAVFAPQPGIGELGTLAGTVRAAGLPVTLIIDGDSAAVPAAVDVSVYRIVQEALTNVLKHAGPARADVTIGCAAEAVTIEITDNGIGERRDRARAGGHGLGGMRERAAIFGGQFHAGPRPGGGFTVRARLPLKDSP